MGLVSKDKTSFHTLQVKMYQERAETEACHHFMSHLPDLDSAITQICEDGSVKYFLKSPLQLGLDKILLLSLRFDSSPSPTLSDQI